MAITLRELGAQDMDQLFAWGKNERAIRMASFTRADADDREAFDRHRERIRLRSDVVERGICECGVLVGSVASFIMEGKRELTYWVDPSCWGRGVASEGVRQFLLLDTSRPMVGRVAAQNIASTTVLLRNGFVEVGRDHGWAAGIGQTVEEIIYDLQ